MSQDLCLPPEPLPSVIGHRRAHQDDQPVGKK
jgi:hypothetical protein